MLTNKMIKLSFFLAFLSLCACANSSYFLLKNHHFDTPQTRGEAYKFSAHIIPVQTFTTTNVLVTDTDDTPELIGWNFKRNDEDMEGYSESPDEIDHVSFLMDLSLSEQVDISLDLPLGDLPSFINAKFQFLGSSYKEAQPNDFVGALVFGLGSISRESDGLDGSFGYDEAKFDGYALRLGFSLGFTTSTPELLTYFSNSYTAASTDLAYSRTVSGTTNSLDATLDTQQILSMLGLQYSPGSLILNLEGGLAHTDSDDAQSETYPSFAGKIGYRF